MQLFAFKHNQKRYNKDQRHHFDDEGQQSSGRRARRHSPTTATVFSKTFVALCLLIQLFFVVKAESFVQNYPSTALSSSSSTINNNPAPEPSRSATAQIRRRCTCTSRLETCRANSDTGFGRSAGVPFVPVNHISRKSSLFSSAGTRSTNTLRISRNTRDVTLRGGASGLGGPDGSGGVASHVIAVAVRKLVASITKSKTKCWIVLFLSIAGETAAASLSKYSRVTGKLIFFFIAIVLNLIPMFGFNVALSQIEVSTAYAVWSACGTTILTVVGALLYGESYDTFKVLCLLMIIGGVVGLNIRS